MSSSSDSMSSLLKLGALELAREIRQGTWTPTEVLEAHIQHIEKVNPSLNALVENNFELAREEARQKSAELAKNPTVNEHQRLYGVPFSVKEMLSIEGFLQTAGNNYYKTRRQHFTATIVQRTRDEGAILLGTSNVPELGFWFETSNSVYGTTSNPYDIRKTSGGSSGGEAALVASGASTFGIGSDIGGSIRIPAFFCGIFGHKATNKTIPLTGQFPYTPEQLKTIPSSKYPFTTLGPLTRKAEDLFLLMQLFAKPDEWDQETVNHSWLKNPIEEVGGLKVYICPDPVIHLARRTEPDLQQWVMKSAQYLEQLGAEVIEFDKKFFMRALELWGAALRSLGNASFEDSITNFQGINLKKEFISLMKGQPFHTFPALITVLIERGLKKAKFESDSLLQELKHMNRTLSEILGHNGVLILPPHPTVAPKHKDLYFTPFDFIYSGIFSALGFPSTSVPTGLNAQGLPVGVQIVGNHYHDHLNLGLAKILETAFGGWVPPLVAI